MAAKMPELNYSCEICGVEGLNDEEMRTHMVVYHLDGAASCPFCDLSKVSPDEMLVHVNSTHLDYLTPENELLAFIDDDFDEITTSTSPKHNGWEKSYTASDKNINLNNNNNNNNCCSASSSGVGAQGSPLRTQLNLNLRSSGNSSSSQMQPRQQCMMCRYTSTSPLDLEAHINRQHFDLTSPSFPAISPGPAPKDYRCPLCVRIFQNSPDLELHVNIEHKDVLSPAKVSQYHFSLLPSI